MNTMPNETVLFESESKSLILKNYCVSYQYPASGNEETRSIILEELSSFVIVRNSYFIFLSRPK